MEIENNLEIDSNPDVKIDMDSAEISQTPTLETEENELWNAFNHSPQITIICLAWSALLLAFIELIIFAVVLILIVNKDW